MSIFPELVGDGRFATGVVTYSDHFGGDQTQNTRIVVLVEFGQHILTSAIVDTGALWCILNPQIAEKIALSDLEWVGDERLVIRGLLYRGKLFRMPVTLLADEGDNLIIEATVFVPTLRHDEEWHHPNFLGLDGFLNRLRFAINPTENVFYFGAIED